MKKCKYCGAPLDDDSQFCSNCGKIIDTQGKTCPQCGAEVEDYSAFCSKCGTKLDSQEMTSVNTFKRFTTTTPSQEAAAEEIVYERKNKKSRKRIYIIGCGVLAAILVIGGYLFLKHNNESVSSLNLENETIVLKGIIDENIEFNMKLILNEDEIEGTEYFNGQPIIIKGSKSDNGTMMLYEYDGNTKSGSFEGTIENNIYSGTYTNPNGNIFPFTADVTNESYMPETKDKDNGDSQSAESNDEFAFDAWSGKIMIYGGIHNYCESLCMLDLEKTSQDRYTGKIYLLLGGENEMKSFSSDFGMLEGEVRGKTTGEIITIVLDNFIIDDDDYGLIEYSEIKSGQQIFRIAYNKGSYSAKPIGKMVYLFDGVTDKTKVIKK